jgi:hypothetical protein
MSRQAHERELHRWTSVRLKPHGHGSVNPNSLDLRDLEEAVHVEFGMPGRVARRLPPTNYLNRTGAHSITGPLQRPRTAALSGSNPKAPGSAGGYLTGIWQHPNGQVADDWLRENLYRQGRKFTPDELVERTTGAPVSTGPYLISSICVRNTVQCTGCRREIT